MSVSQKLYNEEMNLRQRCKSMLISSGKKKELMSLREFLLPLPCIGGMVEKAAQIS